ncbi:MAG: 3-dehydroquinate synthase, partial [Verrucomicrobiota bacterium]
HTLGHAIEQTSGYGKLLHGEAVSLGMIAATFLSTKITGLKEETLEKLESILKQHQLPVRLEGLEVEPLMKAISRDKKAVAGQVKWVLLEEPGLVHQTREVSPELVLEAIDYLSP